MISASILEAVLSSKLEDHEIIYDEKLYLQLRYLYLMTGGDHNWQINKHISRVRPITSTIRSAYDGLIDQTLLNKAITSLFTTGYFVSNITLPSYYYFQLIEMVKSSSSIKSSLRSARLFLDSWSALKQSSLVSKLVYDTSIKYIVDRYLRCNSIVNSIKAWNTSYRDKVIHDVNSDAMQFHFDSDHNRFVKIFLYLDDVNAKNGPHMYVPCTNMFFRSTLPDQLNIDSRIPDMALLNLGITPYSLIGRRGTIIFADTHNLHRGSPVKSGYERNILQVQFVDSLFGAKAQHSMTEIQEMNTK